MKKSVKNVLLSATMVIGLISGGLVSTSTAQASSYSGKRSHSVKLVWRHPMGSHLRHANKGYLYSKHLGYRYKSMKSYPKTTWKTVGHEKLTVKKDGHHRIYYHVVSLNGKHQGWIWRGYLKVGVNPKAKKSTSSNVITTTTTKTNKKTTNKNSGSKNNGTTVTVTTEPNKQSESFNSSEMGNDLLTVLNQERAKVGASPVTLASSVENVSQQRSQQIVTDFNHDDSKGNSYAQELLNAQKVYVPYGECIAYHGYDDTNMATAKDLMHMYIYDDAASNWGHKALLLDKDAKQVGIGVTKASNGNVYNAINIYYYGV